MSWLDDSNLWYVVISFLLALLVAVIIMNYSRKKTSEDAENISKRQIDVITQNNVNIANAQERVRKIGGEVILNPEKQVVSRHTKTFTMDTVLVKEENEKSKDTDEKVNS